MPEIAELTGHSLRDAFEILSAHYSGGDPALAESAIRKLEKRSPKERRMAHPARRPLGEFTSATSLGFTHIVTA